ncbi:MAG: MmgE/PrpD family protein [Chloroflexi bacterium]|nr:MmgE/PrpD family protein [Chloroflexota bacterium]
MDAAIAFARNAVRLNFQDIPEAAIEATKKDILDHLGLALAGSSAPGIREMVTVMRELGGARESSIISYGSKVSPPEAAMANAAMAHALDYDDTHDEATVHAGVTAIPPALAIAEKIGSVGGKEFITAVTLGIDVLCRMGLANPEPPGRGWIRTPVYGFFSGAVVAGRLLGLNEDQMVNALGIAYCQAAGNNQCVMDGALTKRLQPGFAARGGVFAALLAKQGITGARDSLEGRLGLYNVYHRGNYEPRPLTEGLGRRFEGANLSFKPYPCCRINHSYIDAALAIAREHAIEPDDILEIVAYVDREGHLLCDPLEVKRNPKSVVDAQFSIPYTVAAALVRRQVVISDFTEPAIKDKTVIAVANRVTPKVDPSLAQRGAAPPAVVEVRTSRDVYSKRVDHPYGHPKNPMSMEALAQKFRDCAAYAARPLPEANVPAVIEMVSDLEALSDMRDVVRLLC